MLVRYRRSEDGKPIARALVYTAAEHKIDPSKVDPDALRIVERLRESGHEAYVVGGAVRDLLLGRLPKDFDIVTDAEPARIKRVFRNARIIGRRFRLVHVYAGPKIFEVSTFRSIAQGTIGNEYGSIDEDALRRDFTCNALYYDPLQGQLVDYVGGFKHIQAKRIVPVIPLASIFKEDPVRMIRCVKYSETSGFKIPLTTRWTIRRDAALLATASPSRLTEEFLKILSSGRSSGIVAKLEAYGLLGHIVPEAMTLLAGGATARATFFAELAELDAIGLGPAREKRLSLLIAHFIRAFLETKPGALVDTPEAYQEALREARLFLSPLNLPRVELEAAVLVVFKKRGLSPLERPRRPGPERGHGLPEKAGGAKRESRHGSRSEKPKSETEQRRSIDGAKTAPAPRKGAQTRPSEDEADFTNEAKISRPKRRRRGAKPQTGDGSTPQEAQSSSEEKAGRSQGRPSKGDSGVSLPDAPGEGRSKTSGAARRRRRRQKKSPDSPGQLDE